MASLTKWLCSYCRLKGFNNIKRSCLSTSSVLKYKWEPDNLKLEPDIPQYKAINIRLQGFDFVLLESYAKHVSRTAEYMGIECERWPVPAKKLNVQSYLINSRNLVDNCKLNIYERVVHLRDLPSLKLPIFLEMIMNDQPGGVDVSLKQHEQADEDYRYIPEHKKIQLEQELQELSESK